MTPKTFLDVSFSSRVQMKLIRQTNNGAVEFRTAANPLSTACCPNASSVYGATQDSAPWARIRLAKLHVTGILRRKRIVISQSTAAAMQTRAVTRVSGGIVCKEILVSA